MLQDGDEELMEEEDGGDDDDEDDYDEDGDGGIEEEEEEEGEETVKEDEEQNEFPSAGDVFALEMELNRENKKMMRVRTLCKSSCVINLKQLPIECISEPLY